MSYKIKKFLLLIGLNFFYNNCTFAKSLKEFFLSTEAFFHQNIPIINWFFSYTTIPQEKKLQNIDEYLSQNLNKNGNNNNFVNIYNKALEKSHSTGDLIAFILTNTLKVLKDIYDKENNYFERKKKVYSIKFPTTFGKKPMIITNYYDFKIALKTIKSNLVFSDKQIKQLIIIINEMQTNVIKNKKYKNNNPNEELINPYTTQVFFSGPPGTGKTQVIYLLSELLGIPIIILSSSSLLLMGNESVRVIDELLDDVEVSGAILYIDEAELLLMNRTALVNANTTTSAGGNSSSTYSEILHKLFTTFLSKTGNQRHNLMIASNKIDIIDPAMGRRIKYFFPMDFPDNFTLYQIALSNFKKNNTIFNDLNYDEAAAIILDYNDKLKNITNNNIQLSHSDIALIALSLKQINKPIPNGEDLYYYSNRLQLENAIKERIHLYSLFGYNININTSNGLGVEEEYVDDSLNQLNRELSARAREKLSAYNNLVRKQMADILYKDQKFDGYDFGNNNNKDLIKQVLAITNSLKELSNVFLILLGKQNIKYYHLYSFNSHYSRNLSYSLNNLFFIDQANNKNNISSVFPQLYKKNININLLNLFYDNSKNQQEDHSQYNYAIPQGKSKTTTSGNIKNIRDTLLEELIKARYDIDEEIIVY